MASKSKAKGVAAAKVDLGSGTEYNGVDVVKHLVRDYGIAPSAVTSVTELSAYEDRNYLVVIADIRPPVQARYNPVPSQVRGKHPHATRATFGKRGAVSRLAAQYKATVAAAPVVVPLIGKFVLKVFHPGCLSSEERLTALNDLLKHANKSGLSCPTAVDNVAGKSVSVISTLRRGCRGRPLAKQALPYVHTAVLLTYVEGVPIDRRDALEPSLALMKDVGRYCGSLQQCFQTAPAAIVAVLTENPLLEWDPTRIQRIPLLYKKLHITPTLVKAFNEVLAEYRRLFLPLINPDLEKPMIRSGLIHGDLSDTNLLTTKAASEQSQVSGAIDFSDCMHCYPVFELAITVGYFLVDAESPVEISTAIVHGFLEVFPLTAEEKSVLFVLVCAHMAQVGVLCMKQRQVDPDNLHVAKSIIPTFSAFEETWARGKKTFEDAWWPDGIL